MNPRSNCGDVPGGQGQPLLTVPETYCALTEMMAKHTCYSSRQHRDSGGHVAALAGMQRTGSADGKCSGKFLEGVGGGLGGGQLKI